MNNIIRENMLRFGTKNLTESQLENIQEIQLNEIDYNWANANAKQVSAEFKKYLNGSTPANKIPVQVVGPYMLKVTADKDENGDPIYSGNIYTFKITAEGLVALSDSGINSNGNFLWNVMGFRDFNPDNDRIQTSAKDMNRAWAKFSPYNSQALQMFKSYYAKLSGDAKTKVSNGLAAFAANPGNGLSGNASLMQIALAKTMQTPG